MALYAMYACGMVSGLIGIVRAQARQSDTKVPSFRLFLAWLGVLVSIPLEITYWNNKPILPGGYLFVMSALWAVWRCCLLY